MAVPLGSCHADDLAGTDPDGDRTEAQTLELVHVEQRLLAGRGAARRELQLGGSSHHHLHDLVDLPAFGSERALDLAVSEHGQPVGKPTDLLESMADVDDGRAGVARLLDDLLELGGQLHVQSGCRLVEHQHLRPVRHGPRDLEDLPGAGAEAGDDITLLERQREPVQDLVKVAGRLLPDGVEGQRDVFGDAEVLDQGGVLVGGDEAEPPRSRDATARRGSHRRW